MGHLFSRAIKRFTQCSGGRNQLPSGSGSHEQQATTTDASQRDQDLGRQTVQSIPVGQSIDSAEYAAFKTSSSTFDRKEADDSNLAVTTSQGQTAAASANVNVNDDKENENITRQQKQVDQDDQLATNDQNKPEVEEAVIKIQALVRGHLTRKALKDAQQQAAVVPPNTLGQSQFDEESLRNPPNAVFSNASPANSTSNNNNNNQHQQSSKPSNNRVPPLESIAEDVESANQSATNSTRGKRSPLSPLNHSSGSASDSTGEPHSTSPSNEAHVSIDLHCDTPASASIDIMDHTSKPMPGIAAVLHHKNPADNTPTASQLRQPEQTRQTLPNAFDLPNLVTFESPVSDQHQINSSSLPSSPPHINLAATTNSHSIDSAEAAAIRIQSAFRGYHTRKHSPYRRRSPANATSPLARPVNQVNGNESNGQPKRSFLRQQDATIVDEDDDEGVEGCERLAGVTDAQEPSGGESASFRLTNVGERDNEENRQSRQRHRADEATTAISDSAGQTSVKNILGLSIDEISNTDDQSTVKELRSDESRGRQTSRADDQTTVLTGATNKAAVLTGAETDEHLEPSEQLEEGWTNKLSTGDGGTGARWSTSVDTDSSNLGAALSLNEDLSEGISQASQGHEALQRLSQQRESVGAAIEAVDESVGDFGSVLDGEPTFLSKDSTSQQQIDELNKATSQLEAALDEATDKEADYYGNQLAENLADKILEDETEENLNELESDDIERRHPSGLISQDSTKTPASSELDQPALAASKSLDQEAQEPMDRSQRLDVVSPDEAIGSGESSPVPAVLQDGNSSDEGQDSDQDQEGQHQQEQGTAKTDNNQQGVNGGKSKKRNRNKKKGKK